MTSKPLDAPGEPNDQARRGFLKTAFVAAAAVGGGLQPAAASAATTPLRAGETREVIAETTYGRVRGFMTADGVRTFRGIPYGGDTSGQNRFMPPTKPKSWTGIRDAVEFGQKSPTAGRPGMPEIGAVLANEDLPGKAGEDCLVLNVWTPAARDGGKRSVWVRFHGGGFTTGTGNNPKEFGHANAARGDVVQVTVNHRLGALGFLDLSQFGSRYARSGNVGVLDLVAALEWVRDNIENFGGDPGNVMISGVSGGGAKVSTLLAMRGAKGLFHKAAISSGVRLRHTTRAQSARVTERFLNRLNVDRADVGRLHELPVYRLLEGQYMSLSSRLYPNDPPLGPSFDPVLDGTDIHESPFDPAPSALFADIPILIGYNRDEATYFLQQDERLYGLTDDELHSRVKALAGAGADQVIAKFRAAYPNASPTDLMVLIHTEQGIGNTHVTAAGRKAAIRKAPVYAYRFDWQSPALNGKVGAIHGGEVPFVMNNIEGQRMLTHETAEARAFAKQVNNAWVAFGKTGDPTTPSLPPWPAYTPETRATILLDKQSRVVNDPQLMRELWAKRV